MKIQPPRLHGADEALGAPEPGQQAPRIDARSGPARILLVEDEVLIQMLATENLEEAGYKVEAAGSATDAMNKVRLINGEVDAAIIDIGLPDRKGDVLVSELRALYPFLPIVIASGYEEAHLQEHFKNDTRITFVRKPYTSEQLRNALGSLLPE